MSSNQGVRFLAKRLRATRTGLPVAATTGSTTQPAELIQRSLSKSLTKGDGLALSATINGRRIARLQATKKTRRHLSVSSRCSGLFTSVFPVLHRPGIEAESVCESLTAELHALAERHDALCGGIINNSTRERRFPSHMGKHFAKSRFHLTSQICSPGRHRFRSSF